MRMAGILATGILIALISLHPVSGAEQTGKIDACVSAETITMAQANIGDRLAQVKRAKTCYACGLCGNGDTSCCGGSQYWTESCTKPNGGRGYKCCKWD